VFPSSTHKVYKGFMSRIKYLSSVFLILFSVTNSMVWAQTQPSSSASAPVEKKYRILSVSVEGVKDENTRLVVTQTSGLSEGQEVIIPGDEKFTEAIRRIYRLGSFSNIAIAAERIVDNGVFLVIRVTEEPLLGEYKIEGVRRNHNDDLRKSMTFLLRGRPVKPSDIAQARQTIEDYLFAKGYVLATVEAQQVKNAENRLDLTFKVNRGQQIEVSQVIIKGNDAKGEGTGFFNRPFNSDFKLQRKLKNTQPNKWWRFWKKDLYNQDKFEEDMASVLQYYREHGHYAAQIVKDTSYTVKDAKGKAGIKVELALDEGPVYHIRKMEWNGNTTYTDKQLGALLGIQSGQIYNAKVLDENLESPQNDQAVATVYRNQGYMTARIVPTVSQVPGDSLDIAFDVFEGDVFKFGEVKISGNSKTKEHVVRRELQTVPGSTYRQSDIRDSLLRLSQLKYFDQAKLNEAIQIDPNIEKKTVDVGYNLTETSTDQLQFSGGWGGKALGVIIQLGVTFNNFSIQNLFNKKAWKPLPAGDGQQFGLNVQANGKSYQSASLNFTEPWFGGLPRPVGLSVGFSRLDYNAYNSGYYSSIYGTTTTTDTTTPTEKNEFVTLFAQGSYGLRLSWPDPYFQFGSNVGYKLYNVNFANKAEFRGLPTGKSQEVTFQTSLNRDNLFPAMFPREGSRMGLSLTIAPPVADFIQYHKWEFKSNWLIPITKGLSFSMAADYGYVGSLQKGKNVQFQRYMVGGSPLDSQYSNYGTDIVYMRGYPYQSISLFKNTGERYGGRILNKYSTELRLMAVRSEQFQLEPYMFFDASNTWESFSTYRPTNLFRSFGVGGRIYLPILGMVEISYGRNLDPYFEDATGARIGKKWIPQFTIGQGF
jgi:outer membrane protein insertion porin family